MGWFHSITHAVEHAAETVGKTVVHTAEDAGSAVAHTAESAWEATSDEAQAVAQGIESTGLTIGKGFVDGAQFASKIAEEGVDYTGKGLVAAGKYVTQHSCDIALGSALGAIFTATAIDGEEEVAMAGFAAVCAVQAVDNVAIKTCATAVAGAFGPVIWEIPGVSSTLPNENTLKSIITFVLVKLAKENPKMVVGTGGQVLAGVIIALVTQIVCEGEIPGGFEVWNGAQSSL